MKRTTISLSDEIAGALEREAHRRRVSASEIVREALESRFGRVTGGKRAVPFASLGRSGYKTTARDFEEILAREWVGDLDRDR